jgi:AbrB family looped-hinge helix DNA binding protein
MTILGKTKITKGFRVTIPKEIREILGLEVEGEIVFFSSEENPGRICFRKL